jgi:hypothetical protein
VPIYVPPGFNIKKFHTLATACIYVFGMNLKTAIFSLYSFKLLDFITQTECVYSAVRAESLIHLMILSTLKGCVENLGISFTSKTFGTCLVNQNYKHNICVTFDRKLPLINHTIMLWHMNEYYVNTQFLRYLTSDSGNCKIRGPNLNSSDSK